MDFVRELPRSNHDNNIIWVTVDRLIKLAHFLPTCISTSLEKLAKMYTKHIVRLDGLPVGVMSNRDLCQDFRRLTNKSWKQIKLNLNVIFHPQIDGQSKKIIQTLQDMLRACAIDFKGSWEDHLMLMEFSYSNNFIIVALRWWYLTPFIEENMDLNYIGMKRVRKDHKIGDGSSNC